MHRSSRYSVLCYVGCCLPIALHQRLDPTSESWLNEHLPHPQIPSSAHPLVRANADTHAVYLTRQHSLVQRRIAFFFLRLPSRSKARCIVGTLTLVPLCCAQPSHNSSSRASGRWFTNFNNAAN